MPTYLAKRLLLIVPTLIGVAAVVFMIMRIIPGDVALLIRLNRLPHGHRIHSR